MRLLAACGLLLALLLDAHSAPAPQPFEVTGVVVSVSRDGQTLTLRQDGGVTGTFRLVEGTVLGIAGGIRGLVPGTRVHLWAVSIGGGSPVALRILLSTGGIAVSRASAEAGTFQGIVLSQAGATVTVLAESNTVTTVLITGTTEVTGAVTLARLTLVEIRGTRNSDGSVSARAITVLFDPRGGTRVAGRIGLLWPEVGFMLADGTMVTLGEETWIIRGTALRSAAALAPGLTVIVHGTGKAPFIGSRVVEISL